MIGRRVRPWGNPQWGIVEKWEPLLEGRCDTLIRFEDGTCCWYASDMLIRPEEDPPLPTRLAARVAADRSTLASLRKIREGLVKGFNERWPGAEHGKAILGKAIDGALAKVKKRLGGD